jgi:Recombination endonuclease VII
MGTKSEQHCTLYRITNTKTGQVFEGRKWSNVVQQARLSPSYNRATMKRSSKWKVDVLAAPQTWNEQQYRTELYQQTKDRYLGYEAKKRERNPLHERHKRVKLHRWLNPDGTPFTPVQYDVMIQQPCAVCKTRRDLVIDHNHSTSTVRGTLCRTCNLALGHVQDNIQI